MARAELGGELSLLKQGLAAILRLFFFVPLKPRSLPPQLRASAF